MTYTNDPEEIRADIERTRLDLSQDVNALGEAMAPSAVARRQVDKVKGVGVGLKDKVMGSAEEVGSNVGSAVSDTAARAPQRARAEVKGHPMAAGMVAVGLGWLVGSLLPGTDTEREAAVGVREKAQPVLDEAKSAAQESAQHLQQPAKEAVDAVTATAKEASSTVASEGRRAAEDVKGSAQESAHTVTAHQQRPDTQM